MISRSTSLSNLVRLVGYLTDNQRNADTAEVLAVASGKFTPTIMQSFCPLSSAAPSNLCNLGVIFHQPWLFDNQISILLFVKYWEAEIFCL